LPNRQRLANRPTSLLFLGGLMSGETFFWQ
jgi:hypothetical protein